MVKLAGSEILQGEILQEDSILQRLYTLCDGFIFRRVAAALERL